MFQQIRIINLFIASGKYALTHIFVGMTILLLLYFIVGLPLYYTGQSDLKFIDIKFIYLLYSYFFVPANIIRLFYKMYLTKEGRDVYLMQIITMLILAFPGLYMIAKVLYFFNSGEYLQ